MFMYGVVIFNVIIINPGEKELLISCDFVSGSLLREFLFSNHMVDQI